MAKIGPGALRREVIVNGGLQKKGLLFKQAEPLLTAGLPPDFTDDRRESGGILRIIDDEHFEMFRFTLLRPGNFRSTFFARA